MNALEAFNQTLFLRMNSADGAPRWFFDMAVVMAEYLIYAVPALLLALWLWGDGSRRNLACKAYLVAMVGIGTNQLIALLWMHPRPFMIGLGHTWIAHAADASFPSDHMTIFATVGLTLLFDGEVGIGIATLMIGLCVAWARIFLGVHFPLDMLGAVAVGGAAYLAVSPLWSRAGERITGFVERWYRTLLIRPIGSGWFRR